MNKEKYFEKTLNIKTTKEEKWTEKFNYFHPYHATSYEALEELFKNYSISQDDSIVDFGCGKGRLNFYINYYFGANIIGIEMNNEFYEQCLKNKQSYIKSNRKLDKKISFMNCLAQDYKISSIDNKFYFFNPFSIQIFRKVVDNILVSYENDLRTIDIILYYPSDDYIYYLENYTPFIQINQVSLENLYKNDSQEQFLIYRLEYIK